MYHISNDKRSKQSAELIYQGLIICLEKKSFDRITISDLQKASSVARTTFYRSFDNMSDVLYWRCDLCFQEALSGFNENDFADETRLLKHYFKYWMNNSDILELLVTINRQDIIYACHMKNAKILEQRYGILPGLEKTDARYFMAIRTGITVSILKAWLDGGRKENAEELLNIIKKQIKMLPQRL